MMIPKKGQQEMNHIIMTKRPIGDVLSQLYWQNTWSHLDNTDKVLISKIYLASDIMIGKSFCQFYAGS